MIKVPNGRVFNAGYLARRKHSSRIDQNQGGRVAIFAWYGSTSLAGYHVCRVIGIPCVVGCTFLANYGESTINPVVMRIVLFAFSVTVVSTCSSACWVAVASLIDTRSRTIAREYYFLGSRFWHRLCYLLRH